MVMRRRLRASSPFPALAIPSAVLLVFVLFANLISIRAAYYAIAAAVLVYLVFTGIVYGRTRAPGMLVIAFYQIMLIVVCVLAPGEFRQNRGARPPSPVVLGAIIVMLTALVWMAYLVLTRRIKWRGTELLELAAETVELAEGGYTDRPRPTGKAEYSRRELLDFADFAQRNLIALSYVEEQRVVFRPVMPGELFDWLVCLKRDYASATWIALDFDGNVTVSIARRDDLRFVEELSFDQLCASLGQVFVDFLDLYRRGQAVRVIDRLNTMPAGLFE